MGGVEMDTAGLHDGGRLKDISAFVHGLYGHDLHARRVDSLAAATRGVVTGASLAVAMIGQALAQARGRVTKHAIKQVDRLLSNKGIDVWDSFARWVAHLIGTRADRRCHGLDRLRRRRPGHPRAQSRDRPWPGDAIVVAVSVEGRVEGSAQRLRGCVSAAFVKARPPGYGIALVAEHHGRTRHPCKRT
jgi:hypothetical protein